MKRYIIVERQQKPVIKPEYDDPSEAIDAIRSIRQQNPGKTFDLVEVTERGQAVSLDVVPQPGA